MTRHVDLCVALGARLLILCAGAAMFTSCATMNGGWAEAATLPVSEAACKLTPDPYYLSDHPALRVTPANAAQVAATCGHVVNQGDVHVDELVNALYFVGHANRVLAETPSANTTKNLQDGEAALDRALALQGNSRLAHLELARVYRLQARDSHSLTKSRDALLQIEGLLHGESGPGDAIHVAAHFLRAEIFIDLHPDPNQTAAPSPAAVAQGATEGALLPTLTWDSTLSDLAVFTDSAQAPTTDRRAHPDRSQALAWLAQYANALGCTLTPCEPTMVSEAWPGPTMTRESVQRAIDYFSLAQSAVDASTSATFPQYESKFVDTYVNLGKARTLMAGLVGPRAVANYGCVAGVGNEAMLNQAKGDLLTAWRHNNNASETQRALACVMLALGDADEAVTYATPAASAQTAPALLMLARVQAARSDWAGAVEHYASAAQIAGSASPLVYLELARAQLATPPQQLISEASFASATSQQLHQAQDSLVRAANGTNWVPRLELGRLYYHRSQNGSEDALAHEQLVAFEAPGEAASISDRAVRAEALLYLSRIHSRRPLAEETGAIRDADDAFAIDGSWRFREQACLARLYHGHVAFSESGPRAICSQGEGAPVGRGSLLEGMYHLRRAFTQRRGDREREWEDAYRAFDQGLAALNAASATPETAKLRDQLHYGRGTAQYCIGFSELGNQEIQAIVPESARLDARAYFASYRVADCASRQTR